jgi:hypothetical protein
MENVALQNQLQAIQLGANLAARRQQRQQIEQQMRQSGAEFLLRKNQAELENRIRENNLAQALSEQRFQTEELGQFQQFNEQVADFLNDPSESARIPSAPRFRSKLFNQEAMKAIVGLDQYSSRAKLMKDAEKARIAANNADARLLSEAADYGAFKYDPETGMPVRNENGMPVVDFQILNQRKEEARQQAARKAAIYEGGGVGETKVGLSVKDLADEGILDPDNRNEVANATRIIRGNLKVPAKIIDAVNSSDLAVAQLGNVLDRIKKFDTKYGEGAFSEYVGPLDNPVFKMTSKLEGLTSSEQKEARLIQQQVAQVVQDYRKGVFGATLTKNEQENMDEIVGKSGQNDYVLLVGGFSKNLGDGLKRNILKYRYYADIPLELKREHAPEIFVGNSGGLKTDTAPAYTESFGYSMSPTAPAYTESFGYSMSPTAPAAPIGSTKGIPSLPSGFSIPQTNQIALPAGWGVKQ